MNLSNPYRLAATQILVGALAAAVVVFAPSVAFAQHGGGGHMGGGGGGGHMGGSGFGGGSHASAPAASHSNAAPATRSAPVTTSRPPVATSARTNSNATGARTGGVTAHPSLFGAPASSGSTAAFELHGGTSAPHTSVIGFPPSESHAWQPESVHSGPLSFSGQGHEIWQDSSSRGGNSVAAAAPSAASRTLIGGAVSRTPATVARPLPPHRVFLPPGASPIIFGPGFGFFGPAYGLGYFGNGFGCDPFLGFGFNQGFGCGGFGYGYGGGFGGGFGYGGYFGSGLGYNFGPGYDGSSDQGPVVFSGDASGDDNGYGPYGSRNPSLENSNAPANGDDSSTGGGAATAVTAAPSGTPAPSATTIYLKDGTSYEVMSYWLDAGKLHYITNYGGETSIDISQLDLQRTVDENAQRGANFTLRPAPATPAAPSDSAPAPNASPSQQ
jgi:hypothetical protein